MSEFVVVEGVTGQRGRVALDELDVAGLGKDVEDSLLVADAAIAFGRLLDLGEGDLVDVGFAVAVATVGLEGCLLVGHFCLLRLVQWARLEVVLGV